MKQDIDSLVYNLEQTHINPFYRYPKNKFEKDVLRIKKEITKNLNIIDFYLKIEPLLSKLEDGHTDLPLPFSEYNKTNPYNFSYVVKLSSNSPNIVVKRPFKSFNGIIPNNSEIIKINGIKAKKIVKDIISLNTGETLDFRAEYGADNFSFYLEALYKFDGKYSVEYKYQNKVKTTEIQGIKNNELNKRLTDYYKTHPDNEEENYELKFNKDIAVIEFKSFDWENFQSFIDSSFYELKSRNVKNLVINLMDNGGGDSDVGDELFQYLLNKPYKQYEKVIEKNSFLIKKRLNEHLKNRTKRKTDDEILNTTNGTIDTVYYDNILPKENPLRFNGNVYLLINTRTFSSAADFAQCFKFNKRGVIIGQETGGLIKSFGDIVTTKLPNSQLEIIISSKLYYNVGAGDKDWIGVKPDILVGNEDDALKIIESLVSNEK